MYMQVPLGVLNMKYDDMIDIMDHLHQYVPTQTSVVQVDLPETEGKIDITKTSILSAYIQKSQMITMFIV